MGLFGYVYPLVPMMKHACRMALAQGGRKIKKLHLGFQFFFSRLSLNQPANVIRHMSILGNMMSSPCYFPSMVDVPRQSQSAHLVLRTLQPRFYQLGYLNKIPTQTQIVLVVNPHRCPHLRFFLVFFSLSSITRRNLD